MLNIIYYLRLFIHFLIIIFILIKYKKNQQIHDTLLYILIFFLVVSLIT